MNTKRTVDLIHGPILPSLLSFALPILLSNIFQQLYNTADIVIVGHFLGPDSLAAVGATTAIFDLIIGFTLGVGNGMGIVIARYYGARNFVRIKEAVAGHDSRLYRSVPPSPIFGDSYRDFASILSVYIDDCELCRSELCLQSFCRLASLYW